MSVETPPFSGVDAYQLAAIGHLVERIAPRFDEIVETMMTGYTSRIPSYAAASAEQRDDFRDGARASVLAGIAILKGELTSESLQEPLAEIGRRRARQGLPLQDVLLAFQIGARTIWDTLLDEIPDDAVERAEIVTGLMAAMLDLTQTATTVVSAAYVDESEALLADEEVDLQVIVEVLAGTRQSDAHLAERAQRRSVDLRGITWCVARCVPQEQAGQCVRELRRALPEAAVGRLEDVVVAFSPGERPPRPDGITGIGVAAAADTSEGSRRARAAAKVADYFGQDVVRYEEVVPLAAVLDAPDEDRAAFVEAHLGRILADGRGEDLVASLDAFYRHGSIATAARALFVHRHTLEYRLKRIEELVESDLAEPMTKLLMQLALVLRQRARD
ncbi:MAG TPA: helix-turn-helix domain-containing protein [Actinomycetota bacterium]|nr:helix-turn-helix domain-containing protein [Actinomycetota bacterium]